VIRRRRIRLSREVEHGHNHLHRIVGRLVDGSDVPAIYEEAVPDTIHPSIRGRPVPLSA
jgi:hypothetical protein